MIAAMAQWEREKIVSRVVASIPVRAKMGKHIGGQPSLGYKWTGTRGSANRELVIDEQHAPVRKLIYELFLKHKRKKLVAKLLNEQGYRTQSGAKFTDTTIARLLRDPMAKGERIVNKTDSFGGKKSYTLKPTSEWIVLKCPAIVTEELWNECNLLLDQIVKKRQKVGPTTKHLLAGYVECEGCHKKMYVYHQTNSSAYTCNKCKIRIPVADLEEIYKDQLKTFLLTDTSVSEYLMTIDTRLQEKEYLLSVVREERAKLKKRIGEMVEMRVSGEWNKEMFVEHFRPLEERTMQIDNQLPELEAEIDFLKIQHMSSETVLSDAKDLYSQWDNLSFEDRRNIVEVITDVIIVGKEDITIKLSYIPTKQAHTAVPTQSNNNSFELNPVKGQHDLHFALPFSTTDMAVPRRAKTYKKTPETLGEHIRKLRLERGLSQREVAAQIGVGEMTIAQWEKDRVKPEVAKMKSIIAFLGYYPFPEPTTLERQILKYRQIHGLTLEEFGKLLGVDGATVWNWEKGVYTPTMETVCKFDRLVKEPKYFSSEFTGLKG